MVAPAIIAAIISAVGGKLAADQQAASQAGMSAANAANAQKPEFEPMEPTFGATLEQATSEPAAVSAYGRKLEDMNQPVTVTPINAVGQAPGATDVTPPSMGTPPGVEGVPPALSPNDQYGVPPALSPNYGTPPPEQGDGQFMGMNGLELAQLGLMLGSQLFQRQPGPAPPGLPHSSFSPMRPVFRG